MQSWISISLEYRRSYKKQFLAKQFTFVNSFNRMLAESEHTLRGNLQTFVCVVKDTCNSISQSIKKEAPDFAKIDKAAFERLTDKPMVFKNQLAIKEDSEFSFSTLKLLKTIAEEGR